ncbi:MAG: hypothetical protein LC753_11135 [Acidobacteria bacterium]|nr:hypothetical protein [Acidobacteriota bacterium]
MKRSTQSRMEWHRSFLSEGARDHVLSLPHTDDSWTDEDEVESEEAEQLTKRLNARVTKLRRLLRENRSAWATLEPLIDELIDDSPLDEEGTPVVDLMVKRDSLDRLSTGRTKGRNR